MLVCLANALIFKVKEKEKGKGKRQILMPINAYMNPLF
jgi:hypothetical protein